MGKSAKRMSSPWAKAFSGRFTRTPTPASTAKARVERSPATPSFLTERGECSNRFKGSCASVKW